MLNTNASRIVLASASPSRAAVLEAAGIRFEVEPAGVDERAIRDVLEKSGGTVPADMAEVLARAKAEAVSAGNATALVIGADQILELDGRVFEKPGTMDAARENLLELRGRTHQLHACAAVALGGDTVWSHTATVHMTMRAFGAEFVGRYLAEAGENVLRSVGAYQLEGPGVHLFEKIDGDYFTVLGLPLLPLLDFLRREGAVSS